MKRVVVAGGSCGPSMIRLAETIKQKCQDSNLSVNVSMQNLWESGYVDPRAHLVIQLFPFFRELHCTLLDGRPFLNNHGNTELLETIVTILREEG
jgi:hypothetical protein